MGLGTAVRGAGQSRADADADADAEDAEEVWSGGKAEAWIGWLAGWLARSLVLVLVQLVVHSTDVEDRQAVVQVS